jgi:hypothetical protein
VRTAADSVPGPKIDITLLQAFHVVVKQGSFSVASRVLNLSYQSAAIRSADWSNCAVLHSSTPTGAPGAWRSPRRAGRCTPR